MDDNTRWPVLERIFHAALALEPVQRADYIRGACGEDEELHRRMQSLLAHDDSYSLVDTGPRTAPAGPNIGPYRVLSKLGSGGMGDVYLALDSRLGRRVAVKVLPPRFTADPERKDRFLREARAASALNHPNVVAVHDFSSDGELDYLVMEYVPGKPLDRLIPRDGLKLREALGYAVQIADALACAHAAGIVHRDLKPANIVITEAGIAKVLDFGLAKLTAALAHSTQTGAGMILGTVAYMSPEQAAGGPVDTRSDIFSFGSLLYEMTTGRRVFQRDSTAATLAAIANDEPLSADKVGEGVPRNIAGVIERCMCKDPGKRFGSMVELTSALTAIRDNPSAIRRDAPMTRHWVPWTAAGVAAALMIALAGAALVWSWNPGNRRPESLMPSPPVPLTTYPFQEYSPTFSPDGSQVAFVWQGPKGDNSDIYVKVVGEDAPVRLTKDPLLKDGPAWSPDGRRIAFLRHLTPAAPMEQLPGDEIAVIVIPATGGPERKITSIHSMTVFCGKISWDASSTWLTVPDKPSPRDNQSLYLVSTRDGEKRRLTYPPRDIQGDDDPSFSPDGRFIAFTRGQSWDSRDLYLLHLADDFTPIGEPVRLTFDARANRSPAWSTDGSSVIYASGSHNPRLWRTRLPKPDRPPAPAELLAFAGYGAGTPAISRKGMLAFASIRKDADIQRLELVGRPAEPRAPDAPVTAVASSHLDHTPQYSPDGRRIAFASDRSGEHEIWVCDRDGSNSLPLTSFGGPYTADPFWSPDGLWIAFTSRTGGRNTAYIVSSGGGAAKRLTDTQVEASVAGWSRDGKWIYVTSAQAAAQPPGNRIWRIAPSGGPLVPVTKGPGEGRAIESPDARFLYYLRDSDWIGVLWRMPLPSGEPEKVLDSVYGLNFDVSNEGVFFVPSAGHTSLQFLRFADRRLTTVAHFGNSRLAYGMSLARDGRSILFSMFIDHPADLMLVENFR